MLVVEIVEKTFPPSPQKNKKKIAIIYIDTPISHKSYFSCKFTYSF